jgi:hypothetical protein
MGQSTVGGRSGAHQLIADSRRLLATACTLLEDPRAIARRLVSPNGARFDSPGRQPWVTHSTETQAPKGRDSRKGRRATTRNRAPLGPLGLHVELRRTHPGLTRPGLSNPAPDGADKLAAAMKCEPALPAGILAHAFSRYFFPGGCPGQSGASHARRCGQLCMRTRTPHAMRDAPRANGPDMRECMPRHDPGPRSQIVRLMSGSARAGSAPLTERSACGALTLPPRRSRFPRSRSEFSRIPLLVRATPGAHRRRGPLSRPDQ